MSEELESDAARLEQAIGKDFGAPASRQLSQLRNDLAQAIARKDFKSALKLSAALAAAGNVSSFP